MTKQRYGLEIHKLVLLSMWEYAQKDKNGTQIEMSRYADELK
jgi:hypothetical protein